MQFTTGDTFLSPGIYTAALWAAGGVIEAVRAVFEGRVKNAFCLIRPPGHHAMSASSGGFCVFNNVAIGARYAQTTFGVKRVLIVDWDVHHGDGTQEIFGKDPSVFYFSTHEWGIYPVGSGTMEETGVGNILNVPLAGKVEVRKKVIEAFEAMAKKMEEFKPEFVVISAGFDSRVGDPLGHMDLTDEDFKTLTRIMRAIATKWAGGRLVSALEGGYNLEGLAKAAKAHVEALMEL